MVNVLAKGALFEIRDEGSLAICKLHDVKEVTKEEGLRCAQLIRDTMMDRVLVKGSHYKGVLFDVREGPSTFGPKTRAELGAIFARAQDRKLKVAVLVSSSATQRLQFGNLCAEFASGVSRVGRHDDELADFW